VPEPDRQAAEARAADRLRRCSPRRPRGRCRRCRAGSAAATASPGSSPAVRCRARGDGGICRRGSTARRRSRSTVAVYSWDSGEGAFLPFALDVLTLEGERIKEVTAFITRSTESGERSFYERWPEQPLDPARVVFGRFGLPDRLV